MPKVRNPRHSRIAQDEYRGGSPGLLWSLSSALPEVPRPLENQRMGGRSLEIRPLPALLSPGFEHLERTILSPAALDRDPAALWRDPLSMSGLPLQFRKLPRVQGKA
jgi:hypothetical protein